MLPEIYVKHRLYLKQMELLRKCSSSEVLPLSFNYQNLIIVDTGTVEAAGDTIVFQTFSCGCGPQPMIRGGLLQRVITWQCSAIRQALANSANKKDVELRDQDLVTEVYVVDCCDQQKIVRALKQHFGEKKEICFFK